MDISDYEKKLTKATNELNKFVKGGTANIGSLGNAFAAMTGRSSGALTGLVGAVGGLAASFGLVTSASAVLAQSVTTAMNFEKSMSSLRALTGLGDSEMQKLQDAAIKLGSTTTQSASQVADAFKLIGSAKPELLSNVDALASVTKEAITLAEASGMEVPEAAAALTTALNQMGKGANDATRFVNVLAAGAQQGAGDITWLNSAITQSGTAAKAVGTEFEELVANLEQLAQGGFDASSAGTALRSIIMNLEKQSSDNLKPSVVGLTTAFKNLKTECKSLSDYQDIAGKQFASQAMMLAENAEKADKMRESITGTQTATEMAAKANDNFAGSVKNLSSAWEGLMLTINSSNGFLRGWVDGTTKLVNNMRYLIADKDQKVTMGADAILNGVNGKEGIKGTIKGRMDATIAEGWSQETVIKRALADLDKWYVQRRRDNRHDTMMLKALNEAYVEAQRYVQGYFEEAEKAKKETDALNNALNGGDGKPDKPKKTAKIFDEGSIGYYQQKLKEANDAVISAADAEAREAARRIVSIYEREIAKLEGKGLSTGAVSVTKDTAVTTGLGAAAANMDTSGIDEAVRKNEAMADSMEKIKDFKADAAKASVDALTNAFQSLGQAVGGTTGNILSLIGTMAQQVAQGVVTIASLMAQAKAAQMDSNEQMKDAAAKTFNAHAMIPFVGIALGIGFVASMIASMRNMPKFAEGAYADRPTFGIFGEAGPELVLPERKLDEAFRRNADKMGMGGKVEFVIRDSELVGILNNYGARSARRI